MEHMSESLQRASITVHSKDPYATAHSILHWAARWGKLIERENRLLTTGPRTTATVKFYIERDLDKFTHVHIAFDMSGDFAAASLSTVVEATLESSLPTTRGIATAAFRDVYLSRLWSSHLRLARELAEDIVTSARQQLASAASGK